MRLVFVRLIFVVRLPHENILTTNISQITVRVRTYIHVTMPKATFTHAQMPWTNHLSRRKSNTVFMICRLNVWIKTSYKMNCDHQEKNDVHTKKCLGCRILNLRLLPYVWLRCAARRSLGEPPDTAAVDGRVLLDVEDMAGTFRMGTVLRHSQSCGLEDIQSGRTGFSLKSSRVTDRSSNEVSHAPRREPTQTLSAQL